MVAACAGCTFTAIVSLLLLLLGVECMGMGVGAMTACTAGVRGRTRVVGRACAHGDSLHLWYGHWRAQSGWLTGLAT